MYVVTIYVPCFQALSEYGSGRKDASGHFTTTADGEERMNETDTPISASRRTLMSWSEKASLGDALMWLMKTLLTMECTNQRGQVSMTLGRLYSACSTGEFIGLAMDRYAGMS